MTVSSPAVLNALTTNQLTAKDINQSLHRLKSGLKINSNADDNASATIIDTLKSKTASTTQNIKSANETLAMLQMADNAIDKQLKILDTIKSRAIKASSDSITTEERKALQKEIVSLLEDLDTLTKTTRFNDHELLSGAFKNKQLQISDKSSDQIRYSIRSTKSTDIGRVRYETTNGGSRDISNLQLNFKGAGINGEDVPIEPFHLSSTPGRNLKDFSDHINRHTNQLGGIRAIYKEGVPPTAKEAALLQEHELAQKAQAQKELKAQNAVPQSNVPPTAIFYDEAPVPKWVGGDLLEGGNTPHSKNEGAHNNNHPDTSATPPVEGNKNPTATMMDPRVKHEDDGQGATSDDGGGEGNLKANADAQINDGGNTPHPALRGHPSQEGNLKANAQNDGQGEHTGIAPTKRNLNSDTAEEVEKRVNGYLKSINREYISEILNDGENANAKNDGGSSLSGLTRQSTMITDQEKNQEWIPVSSTRMTEENANSVDPRVKHEDDGQGATSDDGRVEGNLNSDNSNHPDTSATPPVEGNAPKGKCK